MKEKNEKSNNYNVTTVFCHVAIFHLTEIQKYKINCTV